MARYKKQRTSLRFKPGSYVSLSYHFYGSLSQTGFVDIWSSGLDWNCCSILENDSGFSDVAIIKNAWKLFMSLFQFCFWFQKFIYLFGGTGHLNLGPLAL
jgi:hypothetical protein